MGFFASLGIVGSLFEAGQAAKQSRKAIKAIAAVPPSPIQDATVKSIIETVVPNVINTQIKTRAKRAFQAQGRAIGKAVPGAAVAPTDATRSGGRVARLLAAESARIGTTAGAEEQIGTLRRGVATDRLGRLSSASRLESGQKVFRTRSDLLRKELFQEGRAKVGQALGQGIGSTIKALAGAS